jgi:hypothetical protein
VEIPALKGEAASRLAAEQAYWGLKGQIDAIMLLIANA